MTPHVTAVHRSGSYTFSKPTVTSILLMAGLGVEDDVHSGNNGAPPVARSRAIRTSRTCARCTSSMPSSTRSSRRAGFAVAAGAMGENVTTRDVDLLALPMGRASTSVPTRSSRSPACATRARSSTVCSRA